MCSRDEGGVTQCGFHKNDPAEYHTHFAVQLAALTSAEEMGVAEAEIRYPDILSFFVMLYVPMRQLPQVLQWLPY